jgi:hypothetical protein
MTKDELYRTERGGGGGGGERARFICGGILLVLELPLASGATALGSVKHLHTDLEAVVDGLNEIIGF